MQLKIESNFTIPQSPEKTLNKYNWVDIGRSVAILLVITVHTGELFTPGTYLTKLTGLGDLGVQLFFILSAFTLFNSFSKRYDLDKENRNKFFFIRRLARIAPLYTVSAVFYTVVEIITKGFYSVKYWKVLVSILYLNGIILLAINYIPPGGWSIGTEMLFYLFIPILFVNVNTLKKSVLLVLFTLVLSNVINLADKYLIDHYTHLKYEDIRAWQLYFWLPNQFPVFAFGIFIYNLFNSLKLNKPVQRLCLILSVVFFFLLSQFPYSLQYPVYFFQREYVYSIVFCLFLIGIKDLSFNTAISKLFIKIGRYSFSMYLTHFFLLNVIKYIFHDVFRLNFDNIYFIPFYLAVVIVTILFSSAIHNFEMIGIKIGNGFIEKIKARGLIRSSVQV